MIYTGYYAKLKEYESKGLTPVSIAGKCPEFYKGIQYKKFAPSWDIFSKWKSGEIDNFQYTTRFQKEVLDRLDKLEVKEFLDSFKNDRILLCYEKSGEFCHRHIVADWIENSFGYRVEEFTL